MYLKKKKNLLLSFGENKLRMVSGLTIKHIFIAEVPFKEIGERARLISKSENTYEGLSE